VPEGDWYQDFGSFKICGNGPLLKMFLLRGEVGGPAGTESWQPVSDL